MTMKIGTTRTRASHCSPNCRTFSIHLQVYICRSENSLRERKKLSSFFVFCFCRRMVNMILSVPSTL